MSEERLKELAKVALDICTASMNFTSGFLSDEEVKGLRELAEYLGVDPMLATPDNFKPKYCPSLPEHNYGKWVPRSSFASRPPYRVRYCDDCGKRERENL